MTTNYTVIILGIFGFITVQLLKYYVVRCHILEKKLRQLDNLTIAKTSLTTDAIKYPTTKTVFPTLLSIKGNIASTMTNLKIIASKIIANKITKIFRMASNIITRRRMN